VCATILDPILVPHRAPAGTADADAARSASPAGGGADVLLSRSAEERSRDAFLRVLLLVDALPNKISLMMEDWYRVSRLACTVPCITRLHCGHTNCNVIASIVTEMLPETL
jgi:hypothetical protein